jgi:GNAT superfamily N-acetyltransferase
VGDAPVLYSRWRLEDAGPLDGASSSDGAGGAVAVIDRLAVLPSHRGRGFSSRALEFLLGDVEETARGMQRWLAGVAATVPVALGPMGEKLQGKWGFEVVGSPYPERNATFVRMLRRPQPQPQAPPT